MYKNIRDYLLLTLLAISCLCVGCRAPSKATVSVDKKSPLSIVKSTSIGAGLDKYGYFSKKDWRRVTTEQKTDAVQFTGEYSFAPEAIFSRCYNAERCKKLKESAKLLTSAQWGKICTNTYNACRRIRKVKFRALFLARTDNKDVFNVGPQSGIYTCSYENGATKDVVVPAIRGLGDYSRQMTEILAGGEPSFDKAACQTSAERVAFNGN